MIALLISLFEHTLVGSCLVAFVVFFLSAAALLRLLPTLLSALVQLLRVFLLLSFRLYHGLLTELAPHVEARWGVDITDGVSRLAATTALSVGIGFIPTRLLLGSVTLWGIGLLALHGLIIGLVWDELLEPGDLRLGERIP